jgi:hypothetical protein
MRRNILLFALLLIATSLLAVSPAQGASTLVVDDDSVECPGAGYATIGTAIAAALAGDTIVVCPGTYAEDVTVNKQLFINGAQAGVDARGRAAAESVVTPTAAGFKFVGGSAGTTIDGFTISGGTHGITSSSGPIDDVSILNNVIDGFTGTAMFMNDSGIDITVDQNAIDAFSKAGGGGIVHFDTDTFDGLHFTNNTVQGYGGGTGFFVDGTQNIDASVNRDPLIDGNLFDGSGTGMNLGRGAFVGGTISNNTYSNNLFDGLQGGIQDTTIEFNTFSDNGRFGLALTSFGAGLPYGAQDTLVTDNEFTGNGFAMAGSALLFSSGQAPGTISTNEAHQNNISGNSAGANYGGTETIDVECNWWGAFGGPSGDGPGTGDSVNATGGGSLDFEPWLTAPAPGGPCDGPVDLQGDKEDIRDEVWSNYPSGDDKTDDQIADATDALHQSISPIYWVDGTHLRVERDGKKVFDREKDAVKKLMEIGTLWADDAIQDILDIDRMLAQVAIDEAPAGNDKDKALEELAAGDAERVAGKYDKAVDKYKKAWENAVKA